MPNNISFRLLITSYTGSIVEDIELMNDVSDFNVDAAKIQYKLVNGNYDRGILQGISALGTGTKISFSLPIYPRNGNGAQDELQYWKRYLNNSNIYKFYVIRTQNGKEYRREVKPTDTLKFKSTFYNNAGSSQLAFQAIDNFYIGEKITETIAEFSGIGAGSFSKNFNSETDAKTMSEFKITFGNTASIYCAINFYAVTGTGVSFALEIPRSSILTFENGNLYLEGVGYAKTSVFYSGTPPYIEIGTTALGFITNIPVQEFELSYKPLVDL